MIATGRLSAQPTTAASDPSAQGPVSPPASVEELERRLRELAERVKELESADGTKTPQEAAVDGKSSVAAPGQAPEAPAPPREEPSAVSQTGPISGYMDFHLNRPEHQDPLLDFHRFVLLFNHSFTDRIRFIGELELEHALV